MAATDRAAPCHDDTILQNREEIMAERDDILEMVDEDGNVLEFEHLLTFQVEDDYFLAMTAAEDTEQYHPDEVLIMRIEEDEEGEETFLPIESDEELEELWKIFLKLYEEEEDDSAEDGESAAPLA